MAIFFNFRSITLIWAITASYGIEIGLVRPEMLLIFLSGRRLFSFDTEDINRYKHVVVT